MSGICIICLNTWESTSSTTTTTNNTTSRFEKELEVNQKKFLLQSFCRHFNIPLVDPTIDWNFHNEDLPFCSSCQETTKNLIDLVQQLQSVRRAVGRVENVVKNGIVGSSVVDVDGSGDGRVQILRDLIVGPELCLLKLPHQQTYSTKEEYDKIVRKSENGKRRTNQHKNNQPKLNYTNVHSEEAAVKVENFDEISDCDDPSILISPGDVEVLMKNYDDDNDNGRDDDPPFDDKNLETEIDEIVSSGDEKVQIRKNVKKRKRSTLSKNNKLPKEQPPPPRPNKSVKKVAKRKNKNTNKDNDHNGVKQEHPSDPALTTQDDDDESKTEGRNNIVDEGPGTDSAKQENSSSRRKIVQVSGEESKFSFCDFEISGTEHQGFRCCLCPNKVYNRRYDVVRHIRWTHMNEEKKCLCDTCGKRFHKESELKRHVKTHGPVQPVICTICGGVYKDESLLSKHMLTMHEGGNTALCQYCSMLFVSEHKLLRHIEQFHADLTTQQNAMLIFRCDHCDCTFIRNASLTRHMRRYHKDVVAAADVVTQPRDKIRHNNNKAQISSLWPPPPPPSAEPVPPVHPYPCPGCDLSFPKPSELAEHVKVCQKLTDGGMNILVGMGKTYQCQICNMAYQCGSSLRKHERIVHHFPAKKTWTRKSLINN